MTCICVRAITSLCFSVSQECPAYFMRRLGNSQSRWFALHYIPSSAKISVFMFEIWMFNFPFISLNFKQKILNILFSSHWMLKFVKQAPFRVYEMKHDKKQVLYSHEYTVNVLYGTLMLNRCSNFQIMCRRDNEWDCTSRKFHLKNFNLSS